MNPNRTQDMNDPKPKCPLVQINLSTPDPASPVLKRCMLGSNEVNHRALYLCPESVIAITDTQFKRELLEVSDSGEPTMVHRYFDGCTIHVVGGLCIEILEHDATTIRTILWPR